MVGLSREMRAISILSGFGEAMGGHAQNWVRSEVCQVAGVYMVKGSDAQGLEIYMENRIYKERQSHSSNFLG